jgi:uncharacterized membrane protein
MENNTMTGLESLQLIDSMIKKARNRFSENGHLYLVWGWAIFIITLLQYVVIRMQWMAQPNMLWMLTFLPWIYMMIYLNKKNRTAGVRTYTEEIAGMVWLAFVCMMFVSAFVLGQVKAFTLVYPVTLILYGMPTFISGYIIRFKPLMAGGIGCWVLAIVCSMTPVEYQILFLTAAVLLAWIIPGYLMRQKHQTEK